MFPPIALPPDAQYYYPYVYPPHHLALGNPHLYPEAITAQGKRERTVVDPARKEYRDTESENRDRNERYRIKLKLN